MWPSVLCAMCVVVRPGQTTVSLLNTITTRLQPTRLTTTKENSDATRLVVGMGDNETQVEGCDHTVLLSLFSEAGTRMGHILASLEVSSVAMVSQCQQGKYCMSRQHCLHYLVCLFFIVLFIQPFSLALLFLLLISRTANLMATTHRESWNTEQVLFANTLYLYVVIHIVESISRLGSHSPYFIIT